MCARARSDGTWWHYHFLTELSRSRNGRIEGPLDTEECHSRRDASEASQAGECEGAKCTGRGSKEACSPSSVRNQGVGTINPTARISEETNPTTEGSGVALGNAKITCEDQGVADASVSGREDQGVRAKNPHNFGKQDVPNLECKMGSRTRELSSLRAVQKKLLALNQQQRIT